MAESARVSTASVLHGGCDVLYDKTCDLCNPKVKEAVGYCSDCKDYLCEDCFNYHRKPKPTRNHVLVPDDQHRESHQAIDNCTEICTDHAHKHVEYFCFDDDMSGCSECIILNHRTCQKVDHILKLSGDILNSAEYKSLLARIESLTQLTVTAIKTLQDQTKCSQTYYNSNVDAFRQLKQDLSQAMERLESTFTGKLDLIKQEDEMKVKSHINKYTEIQEELLNMNSKFSHLQENRNFCQIFIEMKRYARQTDILDSKLGHPKHDTAARRYKLRPSNEVQVLLDCPDTAVSLDLISDASTGLMSPEAYTTDDLTETIGITDHKFALSSLTNGQVDGSCRDIGAFARVQNTRAVREPVVEPYTSYNVKTRGDSETSAISGCVLFGDKVVVVDNENNRVKLIDTSRDMVTSHLKLSGIVWDVAKISSKQIAVTSYNKREILILNVGEKLKLKREFIVKGQCRGIACIKDKLVVTFDDPVKIDILSKKGKCLQAVIKEDKGRQLFHQPWHIGVNNDQDVIYISDITRHTVTSVSLSGHVMATYKDDKLVEPRGLTVDIEGRIYVCGYSSNQITCLTADLTVGRELLREADDIVLPCSICYDETTGKLFIGMCDNNNIKVFQLK